MRIARTQHLGSGTRDPKGGARLDKGGKRGAHLRTLEEHYQSLLQSQLELEQSRDHYAELYDGAPACFVTLSQTGVIHEINQAGSRVLGPRQKRLTGWPFAAFIAKGDKKNFIAHLSRCRGSSGTTEPVSVELELAYEAGDRPVFIELTSMPPSQSEPTFFKSVFRDITDIKDVREAHRWLAAIMESSGDVIIGKDRDGRIISCNHSAERLFGYTSRELIGEPMTVLIPEELRHEETQILRRLQRGERMESYETIRRRKDGTLVPVSLTISPVRDDQGRVIGISNIAREISGCSVGGRKLEVILKREKAGQARGDFLAALSCESLQTIIEEQEAKNDQLNSANEEIISSNEELQNANEELETAREELESTNEELTVLNDELENRNNELENVNNDLHDLLASVNIPIVIVDPDMKIRRFTAMAEKMFKLMPGDVGRSITEIALPLDIALDRQALDVFKLLRPRDIEVRDRQGHWWSVRIGPYTTTDRGINGAVIALLDIDAIKTGVKLGKE